MTNLDSILKSRGISLPTKVCLVKALVFFSSHVWMWELDYKENWVMKNWYFWTIVLEKTLESPLDCKEIQPVNPKGNQSWIFTWRTDAEAETPILWPPYAKNWLIGCWCWFWERLKAGEGHDRGWDSWMASPTWWTWVWASSGRWCEGQESPLCCSLWGHRESGTTEWLNNVEELAFVQCVLLKLSYYP